MESVIPIVLGAIPSGAVPLVVCVICCYGIYVKIGNDRKDTAVERDKQINSLQLQQRLMQKDLEVVKTLQSQYTNDIAVLKDDITSLKVEVGKITSLLEKNYRDAD